MRIAFITTEYVTEPKFDGGLANYLQRVAQGMRQRGHEVEIFTASDRDEDLVHDQIPVHRVDSQPRSKFLALLHLATLGRLGSTIYRLVVAHRLRQRFQRRHRERSFDIIQTTHSQACGLLLALSSPVPVIARVSCYEPLWREMNGKPLTLNQRIREWLELTALRKSDGVYSPSWVIAQAYRERSKLAVEVISPPFFLEAAECDDSVYRSKLEGMKYLLFFGRFDPAKGIHVLVESLASVLAEVPDLHFVLVGRAESSDTLAPLDSFAERVHHLGVLPHSQLYPVLQQAHGVVLPSLIDNLPNTCLEAMAWGRPVIGTDGASFEELVEDRVSGFLVKPGDPRTLGRAMKTLWKLPEPDHRAMQARAKKRMERFDPDLACNELCRYMLDRIQERTVPEVNPAG
ncbi:MAG: glycosyltransferase family 4 protein [Dehalococcoidia bacterium]